MNRFFALSTTLVLSVTLNAQDIYIALTGADCFSCDISLSVMIDGCLSDRNVQYIFPESYGDERHWSKDLKDTYQPHIFSDSLFREVTDGYPISVLATLDSRRRIVNRYVVKQTNCSDLSFQDVEAKPSIDSLDFNQYMTGFNSSILRGDDHFIVISNGTDVRLLNDEQAVLNHFEVSSLTERFEEILGEIGFDDATVRINRENKRYLGGKYFSIVNATLNEEGSVIRMLGAMFHIESPDGAASSSISINQIQVIIDQDLITGEIVVHRLPFSVVGLGQGHYYSLKFSQFITFDKVLVRNSIGSLPWDVEKDGYGLLLLSDLEDPEFTSWKYQHPELIEAISESGRTPIQLFRYYSSGDELYMHIAKDSVLVPFDKSIDPIRIDLSQVDRKSTGGFESQPWLEKVLDYDGERYAIVVSTNDAGIQKTLILNSTGEVVESLSGACYFAGIDEGIVYLHKYPVTGIVYTVDLNQID